MPRGLDTRFPVAPGCIPAGEGGGAAALPGSPGAEEPLLLREALRSPGPGDPPRSACLLGGAPGGVRLPGGAGDVPLPCHVVRLSPRSAVCPSPQLPVLLPLCQAACPRPRGWLSPVLLSVTTRGWPSPASWLAVPCPLACPSRSLPGQCPVPPPGRCPRSIAPRTGAPPATPRPHLLHRVVVPP